MSIEMGFRLTPVAPIMPINQQFPRKDDNNKNDKKQEPASFDNVLRDEIERQTKNYGVELPEDYTPFTVYANSFRRLIDFPLVDKKG